MIEPGEAPVAIEATARSPQVDAGDPLAGWLDEPVAGAGSLGHAVQLSGWAVGTRTRVEAVEALHGRRLIARASVARARPDVAALPEHADRSWAAESGFSTVVGLIGLPERFTLRIEAILADGARVPFAEVVGSRRRLAHDDPTGLRPLMVTCLGRSGTTLLMRLLGAHPEVAVDDRHPHELRCATYLMHQVQILGAPGIALEPVDWVAHFGNAECVGPSPFHAPAFASQSARAWLGDAHAQRLASFARESMSELYRHVARAQDKPDVVCFAEKQFPGRVADVLAEVAPETRELISTRDPRDMLCSIATFVEDGRTVLGHDADERIEQRIEALHDELELLLDAWRRRAASAHVVRYEDLVSQPVSTVTGLLRHAGIDHAPSTVERLVEHGFAHTDHLSRHRTTSTLERSVGRWREELPPAVRERCMTAFGPFMEAFGYV